MSFLITHFKIALEFEGWVSWRVWGFLLLLGVFVYLGFFVVAVGFFFVVVVGFFCLFFVSALDLIGPMCLGPL